MNTDISKVYFNCRIPATAHSWSEKMIKIFTKCLRARYTFFISQHCCLSPTLEKCASGEAAQCNTDRLHCQALASMWVC